MRRENVVAWLRTLTDKQFAELFYEAVASRDAGDMKEEGGHFVLADTSKRPGERRETQFIALPDPGAYRDQWSDDAPICQTGQCSECESWVRCVAKKAVCPLCGAKVHCT